MSHEDIWGKSIQDKENSQSKGPEARMCLECLRPVWLQQRERGEWWEEREGAEVRWCESWRPL